MMAWDGSRSPLRVPPPWMVQDDGASKRRAALGTHGEATLMRGWTP